MNEVETLAVAKRFDVTADAPGFDGLLQRRERIQTEHGVVEIALPFAIFESAVLILLRTEKTRDEFRGFRAENFRREPRDLQHFQPDAHARNETSRPGVVQEMSFEQSGIAKEISRRREHAITNNYSDGGGRAAQL